MKILCLLFLVSLQAFGADCLKLRESELPDSKSFNVVFVSSGFPDTASFEELIRKSWTQIEEDFSPLSNDSRAFNVFLVKGESEGSCKVTDGLLDCKFDKAMEESRVCSRNQKKVVFTVHNSGGVFLRGNTRGKHVMISNHPNMRSSIVHELGHALFSLSDEYDYGGGPENKNCSSSANQCSEWKDLIDEGLAVCEPGCKNKQSFIAGRSIMGDPHAKSFGPNNERLICCSFKEMTNEFPEFCEQYKNVGAGLEEFCKR